MYPFLLRWADAALKATLQLAASAPPEMRADALKRLQVCQILLDGSCTRICLVLFFSTLPHKPSVIRQVRLVFSWWAA